MLKLYAIYVRFVSSVVVVVVMVTVMVFCVWLLLHGKLFAGKNTFQHRIAV